MEYLGRLWCVLRKEFGPVGNATTSGRSVHHGYLALHLPSPPCLDSHTRKSIGLLSVPHYSFIWASFLSLCPPIIICSEQFERWMAGHLGRDQAFFRPRSPFPGSPLTDYADDDSAALKAEFADERVFQPIRPILILINRGSGAGAHGANCSNPIYGRIGRISRTVESNEEKIL